MKIKFQFVIHAICHLFGGAICAVILIAFSAQAQNLFVAGGGTNIIQITPGGTQTIFATGLIQATGVAVNSAGDVFVADIQGAAGNGVIYEYTPAGVRSTFASGLTAPTGLAFDSTGNLFVANGQGYNILEFTNGVATAQGIFASGLPFPNGGLAFDNAGNLFATVEDEGNEDGYVYEFTNCVAAERGIFATGLGYPDALAFNSAGDLFVADGQATNLFEYTNGTQSIFAAVFHPIGVAFDRTGNLFVGSYNNGNIYEFTNGVAAEQGTFASGVGISSFAFAPNSTLSVNIKMFAGIILNNGQIGSNYLIQATGNLTNNNWTTLTNVTLPSNPFIYIDYSSPTNSQQFYRAVAQ